MPNTVLWNRELYRSGCRCRDRNRSGYNADSKSILQYQCHAAKMATPNPSGTTYKWLSTVFIQNTYNTGDYFDFVDSNAVDLTGAHVIEISLPLPMTNAGGTITDPYITFGLCDTANCQYYNFFSPGPSSQQGSLASVPEPAPLSLVALGLLSLVAARRKAKQQK